MSRGEIARVVGLSRTTLSEITGNLLQRGAIVVVDTDASRREGSGRPAERLALDPASAQFMGVDFGHRRVHVVVADASHEIMVSGSVRYEDTATWATRTRLALELVDRLSGEAGVHYGALQGIGIGVPGPYPAPEGLPGRAPARAPPCCARRPRASTWPSPNASTHRSSSTTTPGWPPSPRRSAAPTASPTWSTYACRTASAADSSSAASW